MQKDDGPKYLNSPETPVFHKGRELFALWQVRQAAQKVSRILVVEGYMDVIALHQFGLPQAVATLGTATTRDHAELLFRNCADVYFCFDGDRAGRQAAWRAVESVLPRMRDGRQAHFLFLPDGEDPDSLIRKEGTAGFEQRLTAATPLSEFFYAHQEADTDLRTADGRARLAERCRELIGGIPEGAFRDRMLEILTDKTAIRWSLAPTLSVEMSSLAQERLRDRFDALRLPQVATFETKVDSRPANDPRRSVVRLMITMLVQHPSLSESAVPPYTFAALRRPGVSLLVELLDLCRSRSEINSAALLEYFRDREELPSLRKLAVADFPGDPDSLQSAFKDGLGILGKHADQQRVDDLYEKQKANGLTAAESDELRGLLALRNNLRSG
jgi:DNA primase